MNTNWEAIGAIAELLGAVGVITTLLYLTTQIRQNTRALQSGTRNSWLNAIQTVNQLSISTPENTDVWYRGSFLSEDLEGKDLAIYTTQVSAGINALESLYLENLEGNVDDDFMTSKMLLMRSVFANPTGRKIWALWEGERIGDPRFVDFIKTKVLRDDA
jgi:hypothetical protein